MKWFLSVSAYTLLGAYGQAAVDLVTLPTRDSVQVSIYNSADLTRVREQRFLTLSQGINRLQFSWANTLIDPTSLAMIPKAQAEQIDVFDLSFPPRVKDMGRWTIKSGVAGRIPVEITYLTSGLTWRAFYMGTLSTDEKIMRLQGYVRITNHSGEDYQNAQTRLIVGKVNLLEEIAALAKRKNAFGRPGDVIDPDAYKSRILQANGTFTTYDINDEAKEEIKVIKKEGLSEYFLYTIEGKESIPHGWSKRLPSFDSAEVPVVNRYVYDESRYQRSVVRFLNFKNDEDHKLGNTPIPGGMLKVYRAVDADAHLSYEGQSGFKYIPVNEDVELNLGPVGNVTVEPLLMDVQTSAYQFHKNGNITGWDETRRFKVTVNNTRALPVQVRVDRHFESTTWALEKAGAFGTYEKIDLDSVRFTLDLEPGAKKEFTYVLTTRHGTRVE